MEKLPKEMMEKLTRELIDQGRLIEAGWIGLRHIAVAPDAPQVQIDEMRSAFFAGAQHLFASIMVMMEPDKEPTAEDERRMELIDKELKAFIRDYERRFMPTKGNA